LNVEFTAAEIFSTQKLNGGIKYNNSEKWKEFHVHHEVIYTKFDRKILLLYQTFLWPTENNVSWNITNLLDHQLCEGIPFHQPSLFYP
jgi:hypothetical protein